MKSSTLLLDDDEDETLFLPNFLLNLNSAANPKTSLEQTGNDPIINCDCGSTSLRGLFLGSDWGTIRGVFVPTFQTILNALFFVRCIAMVGSIGVAMSLLILLVASIIVCTRK